ncbi:sulfotransferase family protein [Pontibacillus salicampi]|uniref:sulfotransferase family protein n=1 Tax=Pontibacillus salicampi TaxID=1449801 RepID=UPI00366DE0BE
MSNYKRIISIHGAPRSGTSWLGQLFDSSPNVMYKFQPLFSYAFKDFLSLNSNYQDIKHFYDSLYHFEDDFLDQLDKKSSGKYPIFQRKLIEPEFLVLKMVRYHYLIPYLTSMEKKLKIVAIVRNPCGVLNSWRKAPREFLPHWDFENEWLFAPAKNQFKPEEYYGYHRWKELAKLFLYMESNFKDSIRIIQYEDLVRDPLKTIEDVYHFCGLDISNQTLKFIKSSTSSYQEDAYSVYKGNKNISDWQSELPEAVQNYIYKDIKGTDIERFWK